MSTLPGINVGKKHIFTNHMIKSPEPLQIVILLLAGFMVPLSYLAYGLKIP